MKTIFDTLDNPDYPEVEIPVDELPKSWMGTIFESLGGYAGKEVIRGGLKGVMKLGRGLGPLEDEFKTPEQIQEEQEEAIEQYIPAGEQSFAQKAIERGATEAPTALAFPGAGPEMLARSFLAGGLGQATEELGGGEGMQTLAELSAYLTPNVFSKLLEKGKFKELIQVGRKLGMSDEALAPLIQSDTKQKFLSKVTGRRGSVQSSLKKSKQETGKAFETLAEREPVTIEKTPLLESIKSHLKKLPSELQNKIKGDIEDLSSLDDITHSDLMNFWNDINYHYKDADRLQILKGPIRDAFEKADPVLAKDFEMANKLRQKYYEIYGKLKPNLMTDIIGASEALGLISAFAFGNLPFIFKVGGEKLGRVIAGRMLTDKKFQQLGHKMGKAIMENKFPLAKKTFDLITKKIERIDEDASEKMEKITLDDFKRLSSSI